MCDIISDRMSFGKQLRAHAEAAGLTQVEVAKRLGLTQHRISQIYKSTNMSEALLRRVAKAIGMEFAEL